MNLFGIGPWEVLLVLLVALLILGPQRLPEVAVQLARSIRWLRRFSGQVSGQLRQEFDELVREYEELKSEVKELRQQVDRDVDSASKEVADTVEETAKAVPRGPILETPAEPPPEDEPPSDS
ncbi:MAG: twin-arginine translocase TatA/TatE family subunit [Dehalococcoidia bacterium]